MRVFVTGVKGQLGHDVMNELAKRGHEGIGVDIEEMDITDAESVRKVITEANPDVVIHCAAWTAVDLAEDDDKKEKVHQVNAVGTENIARTDGTGSDEPCSLRDCNYNRSCSGYG